eukprot:6134653-Lingulodinium_polyedra.AAC.1
MGWSPLPPPRLPGGAVAGARLLMRRLISFRPGPPPRSAPIPPSKGALSMALSRPAPPPPFALG